MPVYKLNRNYTLRSVLGRIINFKKGEPTYVPPELVKEIVQIGGEAVDEASGKALEQELPSDENKAPALLEGEALMVAIKQAIIAIVDRNDPKEFTAGGAPHVKAIERIIGQDIDATDRDTAWNDYRVEKAAAEMS